MMATGSTDSDSDVDYIPGADNKHTSKDGFDLDFGDSESDNDGMIRDEDAAAATAAAWDSDSSQDDEPDNEEDKQTLQFDREERRFRRMRLEQNLTATDGLYDPDADDVDERWMQQHVKRHYPQKPKRSQPEAASPSPSTQQADADDADELSARETDAVLSCPMCFTPVCFDCQQHERYRNQFRAMFVENCHVVQDQILRIGSLSQLGTQSSGTNKKGKTGYFASRKQRQDEDHEPTEAHDAVHDTSFDADAAQTEDAAVGYRPEDICHPVYCDTCGCDIAVYDHEEVYHFFNVIAE